MRKGRLTALVTGLQPGTKTVVLVTRGIVKRTGTRAHPCLFPPPLWGRVRERGKPQTPEFAIPPLQLSPTRGERADLASCSARVSFPPSLSKISTIKISPLLSDLKPRPGLLKRDMREQRGVG